MFLDLSDATSLVTIGYKAFRDTLITGTLVIPAKVHTIGPHAFDLTYLTGLDLSNANSLVTIERYAFFETGITGTLVIPANVMMIQKFAFYQYLNYEVGKWGKVTGLDLSQAASLALIGEAAFLGTNIRGRIVTPFNIPI